MPDDQVIEEHLPVFNEQSLRKAIIDTWGPAGAHLDVYDHILRLATDYDRAVGDLIDERDELHNWCDSLANGIGEHFGVQIGEHSNVNNPWANAMAAIVLRDKAHD